MRTTVRLILYTFLVFNVTYTFAEEKSDSLSTSLSCNFSLGFAFLQSIDGTIILQSYNPTYNLRYKRYELGLGIDYYRYSVTVKDEYSIENIWSFSSFLRCYLFKRELLYAELFLNSGYWDSRGDLEIYDGNQFISTFGLGAGIIIPPLKRFREHKYLKNLYGIINYRESFIHRDILILKTDVNFGIIYRL